MKRRTLSDVKLESFCVDYLRARGYRVDKVVEITQNLDERSLILKFYRLNSEGKAEHASELFSSMNADVTVVRSFLQRLEDKGLGREASLVLADQMLDYLFEDVTRFGGPFANFRIFSSDSFVENLSYCYERDLERREERHWERFSKEVTELNDKNYNVDSTLESLRALRESLQHG